MSRMTRRRFIYSNASILLLTGAPLALATSASAQGRGDTIRVVSEGIANTFDPMGTGFNREAAGLFWNAYDRLITFDRKPASDGSYIYDYFKLTGEVAEAWTISEDGKQITFKLRKDLVFHDGTPITADDVKWSLDRAVALPASRGLYGIGAMTSPDQFVVLDKHTVRIDLPHRNRFTLAMLGINYSAVFNSALAKKHATEKDPWAAEWLRSNLASGGAYQIGRFVAGQQLELERFDGWKSGTLPFFRRVSLQISPAAGSRLASIVRGDADIATGLPPKDMAEVAGTPGVRVHTIPMSNVFHMVAMNTQIKPFDNVKVRQAVAYALPYDQMLKGVMFGRARQLTGNDAAVVPTVWPQAQPYKHDLDKARALLSEAGLPNGFSTTLSINLGDALISEPASILIQEALAKVGINVTINKIPGSQFGQLQTERKMPIYFDSSSAFLSDPDYAFRLFYSGPGRWNFGALANARMDQLVAEAATEADQDRYTALVREMSKIASEEVPIILLWQPPLDAPMRTDIQGYTYYFHRQVDFRKLWRQ